MPSDRDAVRGWLNDIRHHIAMAERFVTDMNFAAFKDDDRTVYALTRCLEIISEASRRLPDDLKARHPSIAWRGTYLARSMAGPTVPRLAPSTGERR